MLQNQQQGKVRNSSIELLRILAMILIVFHHFAIHGGFRWDASTVSIPRFWYNFIYMGGKIGVDVFVIISGYHLITNDRKIFDAEKILKFVGQVFFYSVVIYIVFGLLGVSDIGVKSLIKAVFPITYSQWWFTSAYFVLYLIHPFLNKLLRGIDKPLYQKLLLVLVVCWSVIPTFTKSAYQGNHLLWFVTLYAIAGYIRLYGLSGRFQTKHYLLLGLVCAAVTYASSVVFTVLGSKWRLFASQVTYFYGQEKLTTLLTSLSLFMVFASLKMPHRKWINTVASATFGVYLIHDSNIIRPFLWLDVFQNAKYQESLLLIPYSILAVFLVYVVCTVIELGRQRVIERPFMKVVRRMTEKLTAPIEKLMGKLRDFVFGK